MSERGVQSPRRFMPVIYSPQSANFEKHLCECGGAGLGEDVRPQRGVDVKGGSCLDAGQVYMLGGIATLSITTELKLMGSCPSS